MFPKSRTYLIVQFALVLALLGGTFGTSTVQAAQSRTDKTMDDVESFQQKVKNSVVGDSKILATPPLDNTFPTVVTSSPQHGDVLTSGTSSMTIQFSTDMLADGTAFAVNRTSNYLLVEDGADGKLQTTSCANRRAGDDIAISINTVSYSSTSYSSVLSINGGTPLSAGSYQLMVCGSTRLNDVSGNKLNGGVDS